MKTHHATFVLAIVFLTGLIVLWWAGNSGIDPDVSNSVLPPLDKAQVADIKRLEILTPTADEAKSKAKAKETQPGGRIVLERRGPGHWQMVEPFDAAADPSMAETLARNLKDLRKSPDAGTIHDPPKTFGLEPPVKTVRVFGVDPKAPLATLDVGRSLNDQLYVRREGGAGIEVVDPKMLGMLDRSAAEWRDRALFHLPSFQVGTLTVTGAGRDLKAERGDGHWHLTRPVRVPADDDKVEGMVAELTSIRVAPGAGDGGFVANDVKGESAAAYGLDRPTMTIELLPARGEGKPQTLLVGKPAPDKPDLAYARAGDQDDVVLIDIKTFHDLGLDPNALRSQKVADLTPARVEFVQVKAFDRTFDLARTATGWQLVGPPQELTDTTVVLSLLNLLAEAQTSEFLDPSKVTRPGLDPPWMTIRVWQAGPLAKPAVGLGAPPKTAPSLALQIGQYDALRKSYYARIEGDRTILALPETFGEGLPKNALAFRDRRVLSISPTAFHRLTIRRVGTTIELVAPVEAGQSTHWRMLAPVKAATDEEAITRLVMILGNLRAEQYVTDRLDDPKPFGLDAPALTVTWTTPAEAKAPQEKAKAKAKDQGQAGMETRTLRVGSKVPKSEQWYANIEGSPIVFTLAAEVLDVFESEFHTHRVLAFGPGEVRRLVLRWPDRTLTLKPQERREGKDILWVPEEPGASAPGFDLSRIDALVKSMASLTTPRFLQYRGPIPAATGLDAPRLLIEAELGGDRGTRRLRLGESSAERTLATTAAGSDGPVFLLTGAAWHDLIQSAPKRAELPEDPFVPADGKPPAEGTPPAPP